jgi:succinyl-CoA synthetase alpha subunit
LATVSRFVPQCYRDSVSLMQLSRRWAARPGVVRASAQMATAANLALLREAGILAEVPAPRPDDLLLVIAGELGDRELQALLDEAEHELSAPERATDGPGPAAAPGSIREAVQADPALDLALISVPGDYAAGEALKALALGLDVMLFSDNVSLEQEIILKAEASRRGRLLLGPDCGTSILGGAPLGFANVVRRGPVGVVSASGTGLQEVTSLLDRFGLGISQAYGTGGRDLKDEVGGRTALACIDRLAADPGTRCLVVLGKPPAPAVRDRLAARLRELTVPTVTCFLGEGTTLDAAAREAFRRVKGHDPVDEALPAPAALPGRRLRTAGFLRGLYSGGTLCAEGAWLCARAGLETRTNVHVPGALALADPWRSQGHTFVDLGDDAFTRGRPHPMIDPTLRLARLSEEAARPETFRILLDVVLGHGAHPDPAGLLAEAALGLPADPRGLVPELWACVVGTEADPQGWSRSAGTLARAGIRCFGSHAAMIAEAVRTLP